jgi:hypothetical protein
MPKTLVRKVVIYCLRDGELLVFRHVDYPWEQVGIQVPAGTIKDGETVEAAALRELQEETGFRGFAIDGILGTTWYDISPMRSELHERHFVRARPTEALPQRWPSQESHDGLRRRALTGPHLVNMGVSPSALLLNQDCLCHAYGSSLAATRRGRARRDLSDKYRIAGGGYVQFPCPAALDADHRRSGRGSDFQSTGERLRRLHRHAR